MVMVNLVHCPSLVVQGDLKKKKAIKSQNRVIEIELRQCTEVFYRKCDSLFNAWQVSMMPFNKA